eukprot:scaffold703_cov168-Amphora_coffeaeformis.AAC.26
MRAALSPFSCWLIGTATLSATTTTQAWMMLGSSSITASLSKRLFSADSTASEEVSSGAEEDKEEDFSTDYHSPVMWKECIEALLSSSDERNNNDLNEPRYFIDGTLGGGGHSEALLRQCRPGDVVFGCDVDADALASATQRLEAYMTPDSQQPLFVPVRSNFCQLATVLPKVLHPVTQTPILKEVQSIDGILLDLGVSSFQIDTPERGFAFMKDGPLDMRMCTEVPLNAADVCNEFDVDELQRILKVYGDEPRAKALATSIVKHRPLHTTADLADAIAEVVPKFAKKGRRQGRTATTARVFQALRIVVNQEDAVLEQALTDMAPALLRPGGRLVVLSYHSLEDRMAKRVIRDGTIHRAKVSDERDLYGNYIGTPRPFRSAGKARKATDEEVAANSRARSATLRVGIRE